MDVRFKKINKVEDLDEFENSWKELEQGFEMTAFIVLNGTNYWLKKQ